MSFTSKLIDVLCVFKDLKAFFVPKSARTLPNLVRLIVGVDLRKHGISFKMNNISHGLYKKPFTIEFGTLLKDFSNKKVDVEAINSYTLGNFEGIKNKKITWVSNILDPTSKFKDSWFGCYFIFDDEKGKGRKYILKDPSKSAKSLDNINTESMCYLSELDQKVITWSSHGGDKSYTRKQHDKTFYFDKQGKLNTSIIHDNRNQEWLKLDGSFNTYCIIPDLDKTNMNLFKSNRSYVGLPNKEVFKLVDPWHKITFHGSNICRYFSGKEVSFWANVYYGGVDFVYKDGTKVNNWVDTDISKIFYDLFLSLEIETIKKHRNIQKYAKKKQDQIWLVNKQFKIKK